MILDFLEERQSGYSVTPDGSRTDFAWAVTEDLNYDVNDALTLDLASRSSDFGKVETEPSISFKQFSGLGPARLSEIDSACRTRAMHDRRRARLSSFPVLPPSG